MHTQTTLREAGAAGTTRREAQAQQPATKQAFHKWMKVLEAAGLAVIGAWFALALYVSINHTGVPGTTIAAAWFALPVSAVPLMALQGVHTLVLPAALPLVPTGRLRPFATGPKTVRSPMLAGWGLIAIALAVGAFWGVLAYAVWSFDLALIGVYARIIGSALGVLIPAAIILALAAALYRQFVRSR